MRCYADRCGLLLAGLPAKYNQLKPGGLPTAPNYHCTSLNFNFLVTSAPESNATFLEMLKATF